MSSELPDGWSYQLLESLCERVSVGHVGETSSFFTEVDGIPFIRSQNVRPNKVDFADIKFITKDFHRKSKKSQLQGGDLLIVRVGQNRGDCAVLPHGLGEVNCANIVFARPNPSYSDFLGAYFNTPSGHEALLSLSSGSAQLVLNTKAIAKIEVPVPPAKVAEEIGALSKKFDDRITLLRETNTTLESIAQVLFKSWFVDFDPVHAKMQGRAPEGMDEATAALFPDSFEESELGAVPRGWTVGTLGVIADTVDCLHSKKPELIQSKYPFLQLSNIRDDGLLDTSEVAGISEADYKKWISRIEVGQGDCVITNVGRVGAVSQIPAGYKAAMGRNMTAVRLKKEFPLPTFMLELLLSPSMRAEIELKTDVGTILNALNVRSIPGLRFVMASRDLLAKFESVVRPLRASMEANILEIQTLSNLRDTLLPRLISGQLSLAEIATETI